MSRIRGFNTRPELLLRSALWRMGFRYRVRAKVFGRPDIAFSIARVAIFVDGCFWHGCPVHGVKPKSNAVFWDQKIGRTIQRGRLVTATLRREGWTVVRVWEHEIEADLARVVDRIGRVLRKRLTA